MDNIESLHWTELRKLLQEKGLKYTGRNEAIATLKNLLTDDDVFLPVMRVPSPKDDDMLDRGRAYGTIYGEMEEFPTARYTQDGCLFDSDGKKVG